MSNTPDAPAGQIIVNPSAVPDLLAVVVRYAAALLSGWLVRKGVITGNDEPLIAGLLLAVAAVGWAVYRSIALKSQLVTTARAAPNEVAIVTGPTPPPAADELITPPPTA